MATQGQIVEFTIEYEMQNIVMSNVLTYLYEANPTLINAPVTAMLDEFQVEFLAPYMDFLSNDLVAKEIRLQNLSDENEFGVKAIDVAGSSTGDPLPPFIALGLKKSVSTKATRPGSIRIPGIAEADIALGVWQNVAKSNGLATLVDKVVLVDHQLDTGSLVPVVVGRNADGSYNPAVFNRITSVGSPRVTTQNSRKR